jgi:hypothetical protein
VANQTLTTLPQPIVTVEGPVFKMSPTNDMTNSIMATVPANVIAPVRLAMSVTDITSSSQDLITNVPQTHKRTPKDFIFGKVIGEGSFSTVNFFFCKVE